MKISKERKEDSSELVGYCDFTMSKKSGTAGVRERLLYLGRKGAPAS